MRYGGGARLLVAHDFYVIDSSTQRWYWHKTQSTPSTEKVQELREDLEMPATASPASLQPICEVQSIRLRATLTLRSRAGWRGEY